MIQIIIAPQSVINCYRYRLQGGGLFTSYTIIQFLIYVLYTFEQDFVFVCNFHSFHLHSDKEAIEIRDHGGKDCDR